ncbi:MAG: hypothetical protein JO247_02585 [Chloroflexi bacterium]|nr:hypothetical protein [Chloroflexota bacterium]
MLIATLAAGAALGCVYALLGAGFRVGWDAAGTPNLALGGLVLVGAFVGLRGVGTSVVALGFAMVLGGVLGGAAQLLLNGASAPWRMLVAGFGATLLILGGLAPAWPEPVAVARPELGLGVTMAQALDAVVALGLLLLGIGIGRLGLERTGWPAALLGGAAAAAAGFLLARAYAVSPPSALLYVLVGVTAAAVGGRTWLAALAGFGIGVVQTLTGPGLANVVALLSLLAVLAVRSRELELAAE